MRREGEKKTDRQTEREEWREGEREIYEALVHAELGLEGVLVIVLVQSQSLRTG